MCFVKEFKIKTREYNSKPLKKVIIKKLMAKTRNFDHFEVESNFYIKISG